jgi:hypothetical protein
VYVAEPMVLRSRLSGTRRARSPGALLRRIVLTVILAMVTHCQAAKPPSTGSALRADAALPVLVASSSSSSEADAGPPDPLAPVRARAALHGDPIRIPAAGKYADRWLVFVGSPEVARAAWVLSPGADKDELAPVEGWPAGVKVIGGYVRQSVVYLVLETVALLDQPAGLRAVWFDGFGNASPFTFAPASAFAGVRDVADLAKRVDAGPQPTQKPQEGALMAALRVASTSEAMLGKALDVRGADIVEAWQDTFLRRIEHVDPSRVAASPRAQELLAIVREAIKNDHCDGDVCETPMADDHTAHASIQFAEEESASHRWAIRAFELERAPPVIATSAPPRIVPPSAKTDATEAVLREHVRTVKQVLGEAPLGARGTIGVAVTDYESNGPTMVIRDGDYARVFPLSSMSFVGANATDLRYEARFADVDGDGRTDVVLRATGMATDGTPLAIAQTFLAPPASVQAADALVDHGSELAMAGATSVDAAAQAAVSVATRGVPLADACKLLASASTLAAFKRIATADVRVLTFEEPTMPTYRARIVTESRVRAEDVRDVGKHCKELECAPSRPYCVYVDGPYSEYYWFSWDKSAMRLAGVAFYSGS